MIYVCWGLNSHVAQGPRDSLTHQTLSCAKRDMAVGPHIAAWTCLPPPNVSEMGPIEVMKTIEADAEAEVMSMAGPGIRGPRFSLAQLKATQRALCRGDLLWADGHGVVTAATMSLLLQATQKTELSDESIKMMRSMDQLVKELRVVGIHKDDRLADNRLISLKVNPSYI